MPKRRRHANCVPERILREDGEEDTVMLDERYRPYKGQAARVENICGAFTEMISTEHLKGVLTETNNQFGRQKEVFSLHGNVSISKGKATFMGARNAQSIDRLADALGLSSPKNVAHMVVICAKTGKRIQVRSSGLLECRLTNSWGHYLRIENRMYDHTNTVRMSVRHFVDPIPDGTTPTFALDAAYRPDKNNWTITGRGTVMARFAWVSIEWTPECEAACLALCDRVVKRCLTFE
jgi:hypothetical protein